MEKKGRGWAEVREKVKGGSGEKIEREGRLMAVGKMWLFVTG